MTPSANTNVIVILVGISDVRKVIWAAQAHTPGKTLMNIPQRDDEDSVILAHDDVQQQASFCGGGTTKSAPLLASPRPGRSFACPWPSSPLGEWCRPEDSAGLLASNGVRLRERPSSKGESEEDLHMADCQMWMVPPVEKAGREWKPKHS